MQSQPRGVPCPIKRNLLDLSKARVESKSQLVSPNRRPKSGCRDEEIKNIWIRRRLTQPIPFCHPCNRRLLAQYGPVLSGNLLVRAGAGLLQFGCDGKRSRQGRETTSTGGSQRGWFAHDFEFSRRVFA